VAGVFRYKEHPSINPIMKKSLCLAVSLLALNLTPGFGQSADGDHVFLAVTPTSQQPSALTKFNLDFTGGTPKELVAAIEKAMGKPLNVIIPDEDAATKLPPVKVSDMDVGKLFKTLSENGLKYADPGRPGSIVRNYGFKTIDDRPSDNSLWTFYSYTRPVQQTEFNLDFPGGTPKELVATIVKAMGKPLNVIISDQDAATQLPPLKLNNVNVSELFNALQLASQKVESYVSPSRFSRLGSPSFDSMTTGYGFKTDGTGTDDSIWYFVVTKPTVLPAAPPQKACRFYQLTPYLDSGLTVDDITTAIRSGWDMQGDTADSRPQISFHKETKLLIAVGDPEKLEVIDNVLKALQPRSQNQNDTFHSRLEEIINNEASRASAQLPSVARPMPDPNTDFQDRVKEIMKNSAPPAPAQLPPLRPLPQTRPPRYPAPMPTNLPAAQSDK
jgi:hypothetical protein